MLLNWVLLRVGHKGLYTRTAWKQTPSWAHGPRSISGLHLRVPSPQLLVHEDQHLFSHVLQGLWGSGALGRARTQGWAMEPEDVSRDGQLSKQEGKFSFNTSTFHTRCRGSDLSSLDLLGKNKEEEVNWDAGIVLRWWSSDQWLRDPGSVPARLTLTNCSQVRPVFHLITFNSRENLS